MRKSLWIALGLFFVGMAYVGVLLPGVPTTFFVVLAAWAFSKSSEKRIEGIQQIEGIERKRCHEPQIRPYFPANES